MDIIHDMISGAELGSYVGPAIAKLVKVSVCKGGAVGILTGVAAAMVISTAEALIKSQKSGHKSYRRAR